MICPCHIPPLVKSTPTACHTAPGSRALLICPLPPPHQQHQLLPTEHFLRTRTFMLISLNLTATPQNQHLHYLHFAAEEPEKALKGQGPVLAAPQCLATPFACTPQCTSCVWCRQQSLSFLALLGHPVSWDGLLCPPPRNLSHEC